MDDTISRRAAIDALAETIMSNVKVDPTVAPEYLNSYRHLAESIFQDVPSLQPERTETHSCDCERTETHDLVSRQATIDSVCEVCENCEYFYNEKLIQTIKDLPSAQRWIPVTEALPKNGHYYLKCTKYGNVDVDYYWDGFENATKYGEEIVAWMEKPKPYKGGQNETN